MRYFCNSMGKRSKRPLEAVYDTLEEAIDCCKIEDLNSVYAYVATYNEETDTFNVLWTVKDGFTK